MSNVILVRYKAIVHAKISIKVKRCFYSFYCLCMEHVSELETLASMHWNIMVNIIIIFSFTECNS